MIVVDPINLSLVDNEKKDTNSIREINEFETEKKYSMFFRIICWNLAKIFHR